jgi:Protein of unknown function (DUF2721)
MVPDFSDLAKAIQLALAPVFLLSGIAALLGVMTGRLARIIDRGRLSPKATWLSIRSTWRFTSKANPLSSADT